MQANIFQREQRLEIRSSTIRYDDSFGWIPERLANKLKGFAKPSEWSSKGACSEELLWIRGVPKIFAASHVETDNGGPIPLCDRNPSRVYDLSKSIEQELVVAVQPKKTIRSCFEDEYIPAYLPGCSDHWSSKIVGF
jgi:hypothetical protein